MEMAKKAINCGFSGKKIVNEKQELQTSDDAILNVKSYGFVDLEGAKNVSCHS